MAIDRDLQRQLLEKMRDGYPRGVTFDMTPEQHQTYAANLVYLAEHGLCVSGVVMTDDERLHFGPATITAAGLDFLTADGGLSAILGVVTVRLHADTIRDLIAAKIDAAKLAPAEKSALRRHLEALPETVLRAGATDLVQLGLTRIPDIATWLHRLAGL